MGAGSEIGIHQADLPQSPLYARVGGLSDLDAALRSSRGMIILDLDRWDRPTLAPDLPQHFPQRAGETSVPLYLSMRGRGGPIPRALLAAFVPLGLRGVLLRSCDPSQIERMSAALSVVEAECDVSDGCLRIAALVAEAGEAVGLSRLSTPPGRLSALVWDGLDAQLADLDPSAAPLQAARALTVLAATAARVPAYIGPRLTACLSERELVRCAEEARKDGFFGMIATSDLQRVLIEQVFGAASAG